MSIFKRLGICWGLGVGMFILRFLQLTSCFDPVTGLYTRGIEGTALVVLIVVSLALSLLLSRFDSKARPLFAEHFSAPERSTTALVISAFLLIGGGVLLGKDALAAEMRAAALVAAIFAALSGVCLVMMTRQMRTEEGERSFLQVMPLLLFASFWVLTLYLPSANDPILARYYLPILAAAVNAYAFALLAGFFRKETRVRTFRFVASFAVTLSIASAAGLNAHSVLFVACALLLSVFIALENKPDSEKSE